MITQVRSNTGISTKPMNICLLNRYFDFRGTGVTRIAVEVSRELERRGHRVHRVATDGKSLYAYALQTAVLAPLKTPRWNIDVYHALATLEAMWLPKDKSVATYLDLFTTTNPDRAGAGMGYSRWKLEVGRRYFDIGSKIAARCRYLVCISEKTRQDVMEYIHPDESKIVVIRLGIPDNLRPWRNPRNSVFTIGTLSQLDKRKRIDLLIQAVRSSPKCDIVLNIAGQGPDLPKLRALAGDDPRIRFLGLIPDHALPEFYNSLDLFAMPTGIEGYGLPMVEAMACRKPVAVLDDAIIPSEIRARCIVLENYSEIIDHPYLRDNLIKKVDYDSNQAFANEHRWSTCVDRYLELYSRIKDGN